MEEWRPIPGFDGYEASSLGRIRSLDRMVTSTWRGRPYKVARGGRVLRQCRRKGSGYMTCMLSGKCQLVHRLVCLAFHGEPQDGHVVRHKDGSRDNNHKDNLAWGTLAENQADRLIHGTAMHGERNPQARLSERTIKEILASYTGRRGEQKMLAERYGISRGHICNILKGERWSTTTNRTGSSPDPILP